MSGVEAASDSPVPEDETVEEQVQSLAGRIDDLERENKQLREELQAERETRRELIDTMGDTDPAEATHEDILIAGVPVGKIIENTKDRVKQLGKYVLGHDAGITREDIQRFIDSNGTLPEQLEEGNITVSHGDLTEDVRQRLLPIHEMWIDVREGREQKVPSANERRAARLFGRFIRKAAGEHSVGVDASYNSYSMDSASAREILTDAGDMTKAGQSMTVKRAMRATQRLSKRQDCGCDDLESCEHGVLLWNNDGGHELSVSKDRFNALMSEVEAAINGEIDGSPETTDDEGNASEDAVEDSTSAFDAINNASAVTAGDEDSVEAEVANSVVSHHEGAALDDAATPTRDT